MSLFVSSASAPPAPPASVDVDEVHRFLADLAKDLAVHEKDRPVILKPAEISHILSLAFPELHAAHPLGRGTYGTNYTEILGALNDRVAGGVDQESRNVVRIEKRLKNSMAYPSYEVSEATLALHESGLPENVLLTSKDRARLLMVGAKLLDTASVRVKDGMGYYPIDNTDGSKGDELTTKFGFPEGVQALFHGTWTPDIVTFNTSIDYGANMTTGRVLTDNLSYPKHPKHLSMFDPYRLGNVKKNEQIAAMFKTANARDVPGFTPDELDKIRRILLTKELGDVAQVLLYLRYVEYMDKTHGHEGWNRGEVVMITTDGVVYYLCMKLGLSCIYTGAQAGRASGSINISHYNAGVSNYPLRLTNLILNEYNEVNGRHTNMSFGFNLMIADFSLFVYLYSGVLYGGLSEGTNLDKTGIISAFSTQVEEISRLNAVLLALFKHTNQEVLRSPPTNSDQVTASFAKFQADASKYAFPSKISKYSKGWILNDVDLIDIVHAQHMKGQSSGRGLRSRANANGGGGCDDSDDPDCDFLIKLVDIYRLWLIRFYKYNSRDHSLTLPPDDATLIKFVLYYESLVGYDSSPDDPDYTEDMGNPDDPDDPEEEDEDEDIGETLEVGKQLRNMMYFADENENITNAGEIISRLEEFLNLNIRRTTRSVLRIGPFIGKNDTDSKLDIVQSTCTGAGSRPLRDGYYIPIDGGKYYLTSVVQYSINYYKEYLGGRRFLRPGIFAKTFDSFWVPPECEPNEKRENPLKSLPRLSVALPQEYTNAIWYMISEIMNTTRYEVALNFGSEARSDTIVDIDGDLGGGGKFPNKRKTSRKRSKHKRKRLPKRTHKRKYKAGGT